MLSKYCILLLSLLLLFLSSMFTLYSRDSELFHVHGLERGHLHVSRSITLEYVEEVNKRMEGETMAVRVWMGIREGEQGSEVQGLGVSAGGKRVVWVEQGANFVGLVQAKGEIHSHGDSFYKIEDQHGGECREQYISSITVDEQQQRRVLVIEGYFLDCGAEHTHYRLTLAPDTTTTTTTTTANSYSEPNTYSLSASLTSTTTPYNRLLLYFPHTPRHAYFGLGQQFSHLSLGHDRPFSLYVREKGIARTQQPQTFMINWLYNGAAGSYYNSYAPAPIWLSVYRGQKCKDNNRDECSVNSVQNVGYVMQEYAYAIWMNNFVYLWSTNTSFLIHTHSTMKQIIASIAQHNGYTPPIPHWLNQGAVIGLQGGTQNTLHKYHTLKQAGVKISGLWLQDWVSKRKTMGYSRLWWNWQLDRKHYQNWQSMREQLQHDGVAVLVYINPMLTPVKGRKQGYRNEYYQQAKQRGYFVRDVNGKWYETAAFSDWTASMINFTNPEAKHFYQQLLRNAIVQTGARGLMVDFGQAYPVQHMSQSIQHSARQHNQYPNQYLSAVRQVLSQAEFANLSLYTFSRSGYLFTPRYTLSLWAGDQTMNFKPNSGLRSCLIAMLSSGLVGYSNTHCDIGGYAYFRGGSVRTRVLMRRWMQLGALSPVMRTHEGNKPDESLQVYSDEGIAREFGLWTRVYGVLAGYRARQAEKARAEGLPLLRALWVEHEGESEGECYGVEDQYYLGEDVMVAPLLGESEGRRVYMPKIRSKSDGGDEGDYSGQWVDMWTGQEMQGCNCWRGIKGGLPGVYGRVGAEGIAQLVQQMGKIAQQIPEVSTQEQL